jgi:hypothetical protein
MLGSRPEGNDGILHPLTFMRWIQWGRSVFMLGSRPEGNDGILYPVTLFGLDPLVILVLYILQ